MSAAYSIPLLQRKRSRETGLSLFLASLCIVDIFGVFPIIALPRAIVQCGWYGIPLVLIVFALQIYTAVLVGKSWNVATMINPHIFRKNRYPLAAVTEMTLGRVASIIVAILLDLSIFGGGIPNLLVASQNLQLFGLKVSEREFNLSFCYWLLVVGLLLCPIMWLGSPRDMKWVVAFSTSAATITTLLIWYSIVNDDRRIDIQPIPDSPTWDKFISGYGMLAFQFDIHPTLMTIQVDMKRPEDINKAIILAFLTIGVLFGATTGLVVWRYGGSATANVLQIVPPNWPIHFAILLAALQLCLSSAVGHSALFQHIEDKLRIERSFGWKRCATRTAVVLLAVAVGESVPRFDIVMSLIGGSITGPLVFIFPPLMYAKARARLRSAVPRRSSAPGFLCTGPERNLIDSREIFRDPRVHSKSTHYGFRDGEEDKNDGYSFIYYGDDEVETNPYTGDELNVSNEYGTMATSLPDTREIARSGSLPSMVENNRSVVTRQTNRQRLYDMQKKLKTILTTHRFEDWLGYTIVVVGILITFSSTYINIRNTIRYVKFIPPCIINATVDIPILN